MPSPVPADHPTQQEAYYTDDDEALAHAVHLSLQDDPKHNATDEGQPLEGETVAAQAGRADRRSCCSRFPPRSAAHDDVAIATQVAAEGGILDVAYEDDEDDEDADQEDVSSRIRQRQPARRAGPKRARLSQVLYRPIRDVPSTYNRLAFTCADQLIALSQSSRAKTQKNGSWNGLGRFSRRTVLLAIAR